MAPPAAEQAPPAADAEGVNGGSSEAADVFSPVEYSASSGGQPALPTSADNTGSADAVVLSATSPNEESRRAAFDALAAGQQPPLAVLQYVGFCELGTYETFVLALAAELPAAFGQESRSVDVHMLAEDVVFADADSKRSLRQFALDSLLAVEVVLRHPSDRPDAPPFLCIVRRREATESLFLHIFLSPEVKARENECCCISTDLVCLFVTGRVGGQDAARRHDQNRGGCARGIVPC